jgi:hypothetical protein
MKRPYGESRATVMASELLTLPNEPMAQRIRRGDRHVYRHIAGEHLLVSIHRATVAPLFALTPTGAALWEALEDWTTAEALADFLTARYAVEVTQARQDVADFLEQLTTISALQVSDEGAA